MTDADEGQPVDPTDMPPAHDHQRLWTPWRMQYVGGNAKEAGCIFCNRLAGQDDVASLIVHRGEYAFAMMNLYPYNTGHVMIVPNTHVGSPEDADPAELAALATMLRPMTRALRRALNPVGFNVGLNIGRVAGAGVADHLHMQIVPRWTGDANFMPILAGTMVLPEVIPVTYAKIRIELERTVHISDGLSSIALVILDEDASHVLVRRGSTANALPMAQPRDEETTSAAVSAVFRELPNAPTLVGWASAGRAGDGRAALAFVCAPELPTDRTDFIWMPLEDVADSLPAEDAGIVLTARSRHSPAVVSPPG